MTHRAHRVPTVLLPLVILLVAPRAFCQDPAVANWTAPPYWAPPAATAGPGEARSSTGIPTETATLPSPPLPFVAITPCRLADTRALSGFPPGYGPPSMPGFHTQRSFTITGVCGIPADAQAASFNFAVWSPVTRGDIRVFPAGVTPPGVASLNWEANILALSNAAIVPLGTGGAITVQVDGPGTIDLIIDVNGYYSPLGVVNSVAPGTGLAGGGTGNVTLGIAPGGVTASELAPNAVTQPKIASSAVTAGAIASGQVVKSLNGLSDNVTLAGAGGASVTQLGQTITVTAPPGLSSGSSGQTLRHNGSNWAANSLLFNNGTRIGIGTTLPNQQLEITGNLRIPTTTSATGQIWIGDYTFIHLFGTNNTFVGSAAGNLSMTGIANTGVGDMALIRNTSGQMNTAVGKDALSENTGGSGGTALGTGALDFNTVGTNNTAVGYFSMQGNTTANNNTAVGVGALYFQDYANGGTPWNADNTAIGFEALHDNAPTDSSNGIRNTAVGSWAMRQNKTGPYNTAVGYQSLYGNDSGSFNTAIGYQALFANTTGIQNTAVGDWAGHENQTGSNNVFLGNEAGTFEMGSNRLYIANAAASALIYGQFDNNLVAINATDPITTLDVNGTFRVRNLPVIGGGNPVCTGLLNIFGFCGASDARLKKNIVSLSDERDVLSGLAMLRAVTFDWNLSPGMVAGREGRDLGVIAQEVETVLPEVVSTTPGGYKSVDYSKLTAFLIEVAKAQQKEIESMKGRLEALERAPQVR